MSLPERVRAATKRGVPLLLCALGLSRSASAQTFHGDATYEATRRSIDVMGSHLTFLQTQARKQDVLSYYGFTLRWAPGWFAYSDGQRAAGILSRGQQNFGAGVGDLNGGVFFGAQVDAVSAFSKQGGTWRASGYEGLVFAGGALYGVQATIGYLGTLTTPQDFKLDQTGAFAVPGSGSTGSRQGAPAVSSADLASNFILLSAYDAKTGAFLSASYGEYPLLVTQTDDLGTTTRYAGSERRLSEVRAHLQPLRDRYLPAQFGLPMIGIAKLDRFKDNYQERAAQPAKPPSDETPYEIELGSDDILAGGFRAHVVYQVSPTLLLRRAELGYVEQLEKDGRRLRVGVRAQAFQRAGGFVASGDAYALVGIGPAQVGFSYSYNSPDGTTFIPVANAHVFGLQVLFGEPETSRPLIPLVRAVEDRAKEGKK